MRGTNDGNNDDDDAQLRQQWMDIDGRGKSQEDTFPGDVDESGLSYGLGRVRVPSAPESRNAHKVRVKENLAKEYSGLTVRRVIARTQPKHAHVRNYTSIDELI